MPSNCIGQGFFFSLPRSILIIFFIIRLSLQNPITCHCTLLTPPPPPFPPLSLPRIDQQVRTWMYPTHLPFCDLGPNQSQPVQIELSHQYFLIFYLFIILLILAMFRGKNLGGWCARWKHFFPAIFVGNCCWLGCEEEFAVLCVEGLGLRGGICCVRKDMK